MAGWTTPRTWVVGEVVTAAELNQHIRDNLNFLRGAHGCRVWHSANQSIADDSNPHALSFDSESFDTDGFHSGAAPKSLIVPSGMDGYYIIMGTVVYAANATGFRDARIILNPASDTAVATYLGTGRNQNVGGATNSRVHVSTTYRLAAADVIQLQALQNSGGALNAIGGDIDQTQVSLIYLGL